MSQPEVISMEVDRADHDKYPSFYRIRVGNDVKYLEVSADTLDKDDLLLPLYSLPPISWEDPWISAVIVRNAQGELTAKYNHEELPGVKSVWHGEQYNVLDLEITKTLHSSTYEAKTPSQEPVIVKMARFHWEIPYIEQETRVYELLRSEDFVPRFLGHVQEKGRVIGFVLEKVEFVRHALPEDLEACQEIVRKLHKLGILHGDLVPYNFLVGESVKLIDFATSREESSAEDMDNEMQKLPEHLADPSGRGGGFVLLEESDSGDES